MSHTSSRTVTQEAPGLVLLRFILEPTLSVPKNSTQEPKHPREPGPLEENNSIYGADFSRKALQNSGVGTFESAEVLFFFPPNFALSSDGTFLNFQT